jgi:hypothetical protein
MSSQKHLSEETGNIPDDFIEIHAEDVDSQQIIDRIRRRIDRHRSESEYQPTRFPSYDGVPYPGTTVDVNHDPDLYHHLKLANKIYAEVETEPALESSPATRIPVAGSLWRLIRLHAHNLVLFYVNRAVRHEVDVNRHLVSVLNSLTEDNYYQRQTIKELESELESLRSKID